MILMHESTPEMADQDASVVPGGAAYLYDGGRRLAPYFERTEPRAMPCSTRCAGRCGNPRPSVMSCAAMYCNIWRTRKLCWYSTKRAF